MLHTCEHLPCTHGAWWATRAPCTACWQPQAPRLKIHLGMAGFVQQAPWSRLGKQTKLPNLFQALQPVGVLGRRLLEGCNRVWLGSCGENLRCWIHTCLGVHVNSLCSSDTEFLLLLCVSLCETRSHSTFEQELKHLVCVFEYKRKMTMFPQVDRGPKCLEESIFSWMRV